MPFLQLIALPLPAPLWRLQPSADGHFLALELRDASPPQARFLIYRPDGERQSEIIPPNPEWMGIEACGKDTLLLHTYEEKGLPVHRGLYAFDLHTGAARWQHPTLQALGLCSAGMLAQAPGAPSPQLIALEDGSLQPAPAHPRQALEAYARQQQVHYAYPVLHLAPSPRFDHFRKEVAHYAGREAHLQVEVLENNGEQWVHFYEKKAPGKVHRSLLHLPARGAPACYLLDDTAKGLLLDPFFQWRGQLIAQGDARSLWLEKKTEN